MCIGDQCQRPDEGDAGVAYREKLWSHVWIRGLGIPLFGAKYIICGAMVHYPRNIVQKIMYMHNAAKSRREGLGPAALASFAAKECKAMGRIRWQ